MRITLGRSCYLLATAFVVVSTVGSWAQEAKPKETASENTSSPEMKRIFDEDQAARKQSSQIDWSVVDKSDAERRERTRQLMARGALNTGEDYERAAFIFQHGKKPDDFLLAHTLAMIAVAKGQRSALWIASATLDRYLQSIEKPQIFGTQYMFMSDKPGTQEPYDRTLVSDTLRKELGVKSQAEQERQLKEFEEKASKRRSTKK